jgi:methylaspartate ammonia-lyase
MLSKPGLGVDEALMIQRNEMQRTLALLKAKRNKSRPGGDIR